jgi:hypothetical protein
MSNLISLDLHFAKQLSPANLLYGLLQTGFTDFFRPKIGVIKAGSKVVRLGSIFLKEITETTPLLEGEQTVAPRLTSLEKYPDATQETARFLTSLPEPNQQISAEFIGDWWLDCTRGVNAVKGWLFRYGDDIWRRPILWCHISRFRRPSFLLSITCPWFFLKDWWLEEVPRYSTPETSEHNWNRLIDSVDALIESVSQDKLEEICLNLEGRGPYEEREWLIESAQRLSKLTVHLA